METDDNDPNCCITITQPIFDLLLMSMNHLKDL